MSAASSASHDPRYPIGQFAPLASPTAEDRRYAILSLAELPEQLREAVRSLDPDQLNTPYREGGWTVRQLVHHIADSHMMAFQRVRLALTEKLPNVNGYDEKAFATLPDVAAPIEWSLEIVESVHARWVMVLQALRDEQWMRGYRHPELGVVTVEAATQRYAGTRSTMSPTSPTCVPSRAGRSRGDPTRSCREL